MNRRTHDRNRALLQAETGTVYKSHAARLRVALGYPNTYYIGMSNVGFQAVYRFWNDEPDVVCERFFLPDRNDRNDRPGRPDRSDRGDGGGPLETLESGTPVGDFDVVAFSITFEPDELNLISMLDRAGIPPLASDRNERHPLVLAGGPVTFLNPEPLAPFLDVIAVGEAESLLPVLTDLLVHATSRRDLLDRLEQSEGFYIPSRLDVDYRADGTIASKRTRSGGGSVVRAKMGKRADLPPPATYVLTSGTEMSKKFLVEVSRGCPTLCRFCWAGYNYLPKRSFEVERILESARAARAHTSQIGLVSTAVGAHREIVPLVQALKEMGFRVSVSSLRFEDLRPELVDPLIESGEKTLAVAPEAGTDRLRFAIHKRIPNREVLEKIDMLFERGVENLKLYLMVGLPGEREEDVAGIVGLVEQIRDIMLVHARPRGRVGRIIPSINPFIPKPGTPFQWCPMAPQKELHRKMRYLQKAMGRMPNVEVRCKSPRQERLQALLSLGDRRLAPAMMMMARGEADLSQAMASTGLSLDDYVHRARSFEEILPWDHIDNGMKIELLKSQYEKAFAGYSLATR